MKGFCVVIAGILILTFLTTGCRHAARGVERDLEHAGNEIEHAVH
jgi:predicted small secreted protein